MLVIVLKSTEDAFQNDVVFEGKVKFEVGRKA